MSATETAARIAFNHRLDEEILMFVREMQSLGPVTVAAVHPYLTRTRRLEVTAAQVGDRLAYLVDKENLKWEREWDSGEYVDRYFITAKGRDVLDGVLPPDA